MQADQRRPPEPPGSGRPDARTPTPAGAEDTPRVRAAFGASCRRRRTLTWLLAVGSAAALAAGLLASLRASDAVSDSAERPEPRSAVPGRQLIEALLDGRAQAVRSRDRMAFLATLGWADPGYRTRQEQVFDNLMRLPVTGWRERLGDARPVASRRGRTTLKLTLRYRFKGFDRSDVGRVRYLTVARRDGVGWVIVGDGQAQGFADETEIWDTGRIGLVRGPRSLVIGSAPPGTLSEVSRRLEAAVPVVTQAVGPRWAQKVVALVPGDSAQAARLAGVGSSAGSGTPTAPGVPAAGPGSAVDGPADPGDMAALAAVAPGAEPGSRGEDRVVVSPTVFARLNPLGRRVILTHELTHVATDAARDSARPLWLIEGMADHVGYRGTGVKVTEAAGELRREVAAGRLPADLPRPADFTAGSSRLPQAYEESWLACRMIAERYGESALLRLYRSAGRLGGDADAETGEAGALSDVLGISRDHLVSEWRAYVQEALR